MRELDDEPTPRRSVVKTESAKRNPDAHRAATGTSGYLHSAAAVLHGWSEHQHHAGGPIEITEDAYRAAIKAVDVSPCKPAEAALSPHKGKGL